MKDTVTSGSRVETLTQALPYIQKFQGKTIVVKYGGNAMINESLKAAVIQDIILLSCTGIRVVLVHGGGPEIEAVLKALGKESRFVGGLRYTDEETMEVVQMVLCGRVNKDITLLIENAGGRAIGLSGIDGGLLKAKKIPAGETGGEDLGLVGNVVSVNVNLVRTLLDAEIIPVISSVAQGMENHAGKSLNVNADIAAAQIAAALGAEKLVLMTDVRGLLRDVNDSESLIKSLSLAELERLKTEGIVTRGMIPKADCCALALKGGVKRAHILDGRLPHALLVELFTDEGIGTMIDRDQA